MKSNLYKKDLITTKYAGKLSGYTSRYLRRLARSGEIEGVQIGRVWLIKRGSLIRFLDAQTKRKEKLSLTRSRVHAAKYHLYRPSPPPAVTTSAKPLRQQLSPELSRSPVRRPTPRPGIRKTSLRSCALALSVALLVVASGAAAARSPIVPQLSRAAADAARETAFGFHAALGGIPVRIAERIAIVKNKTADIPPRIAAKTRVTTAGIALVLPAAPDLSSLRLALIEDRRARVAPVLIHAPVPAAPLVTADDILRLARDAYGLFLSPSRILHAFTSAYLAFGESVIAGTHAAIRADVQLAYGLSTAAPASAQAIVALLGDTGDALARITSRTPALAVSFFLNTAALPSELAPRIGQAVFDAEYQVAERFLALRGLAVPFRSILRRGGEAGLALSAQTAEGYLAILSGAGRTTYALASLSRSALDALAPLEIRFRTGLAAAPTALSDASLGALGTLAAVVGAALDALSPVERVALATYETIHDLFDSATSALAFLFSPLPTVVLPSIVPEPPVVAVVATSTPTERGPFFSYPTYTTVVQGVSENFMNQSLAALRTDILSVVSDLVRPVQTQVVQNSTTIQQINRIEELHDLVVKNGDFRNSIFDNGIRVSATSGSFTNLTGGTTSLGATTVTGALSSDTSATAPFFTATSATATSTFAGALAIGTTTPYGNGLLIVGTSSPFLYVSSTTGRLGIGTTSPLATLGIQGSLGVNASHLYLADNGRIGIGTTSPDALLSLLQNANGTPFISAYRATDTAPAGDFINFRTNAGTTLFRVDNSGNLLAGGIINTGSQTITSTSQPQFRIQYDPTNEVTFSTGLTGTTTIGLSGTAPSLVFTPQSNLVNQFNFTDAASDSVLSIDTANKRVGVGTTSPAGLLHLVTESSTSVFFDRYGGAPPNIIFRRANGTLAAPTAVGLDNQLFAIGGRGYGATGFSSGGRAAIFGAASEAWTDTAQGAYLGFTTTANGTASAVERLRIDQNGNVGIGTTTPWAQLSVNPNGITGPAFVVGSSTATNFIVTNGGNVGVGVANPAAKLQISVAGTGNILDLYGETTYNAMTVSHLGTTFRNNGSNPALSAGPLRVDSDTIAIGTTQPFSKLDLNSGTFTLSALSSTFANRQQADIVPSWIDNTDGTRKARVIFNVYDTAAREFLRADASGTDVITQFLGGNVGIGTTSPLAQLHLSKTTGASQILDKNTSGTSTLSFYLNGSSADGTVLTSNYNQDLIIANNATNKDIIFQGSYGGTDGTEIMRILTANKALQLASGASLHLGGSLNYLTNPGSLSGTTLQGYQDLTLQTCASSIHQNYSPTPYISFSTADSCGGTKIEYMRLGSAGNFGIGTTSPWAQLSVNPNGIAGPAFVVGSSTATNFVVTNAGNVGVGTANPTVKLNVAGGLTVTLGGSDSVFFSRSNFGSFGFATANGQTLKLLSGLDSNVPIFIAGNSNTQTADLFQVARFDGASPVFEITQAGNVGIGTTSPNSILTIAGGRPKIWLQNDTGATGDWSIRGGSASGDTYFFIADENAGLERFAISNTGNVGIGITNPTGAKLHIAGTSVSGASSQTNISAYTGNGVRIDGSIANAAQDAITYQSGTGGGTALTFGRGASYDTFMAFYTNAASNAVAGGMTERMRIIDSGNVGIGTTSPVSKLQIHDGSIDLSVTDLAHGNLDFLNTNVGARYGYAGTNGGAYTVGATKSTGDTVPYNLIGIFGSTDPTDTVPAVLIQGAKKSGGTGGAVMGALETVFQLQNLTTPVLTVLGSGNVGIGTTTPANKLTVVQTGAAYNTSALWITNGSNPTDGLSIGDSGVNAYKALQSFGGPLVLNFDSGNNVGIGTTSPGNKLDVYGNATIGTFIGGSNGSIDIKSGATELSRLIFNPGLANNRGFIDYDAVNKDMIFKVNEATAVTIKNGGNVGVGNTSPTYKLDVTGLGHFTGLVDAANFVATSTTATSTFVGGFTAGNNAALVVNKAAIANSLYITPDSFIGIGTDSPTGKLTIGSGQILAPAGSASLPSYSFSGDTNTGWYSGGDDTLRASNGGTEFVRLAGNAATGLLAASISATFPNTDMNIFATLTSSGASDTNAPMRAFYANGADSQVGTLALLRSRGSVTAPSVITSGDNLGSIDGYGFVGSTNDFQNAAQILFDSTGTISDSATGIAGIIRFLTADTGSEVAERMTILNSGNVGIGTTTPTAKLYVVSGDAGNTTINSAVDDLVVENSASGGITLLTPDASQSTLAFGSPSDNVGAEMYWIHNSNEFGLGTFNADGFMRLFTGDGSEAVRIDSSGNVGIGTTGPGGLLHVKSTTANTAAKIESTFGSASLDILDKDDTAYSYVNFGTASGRGWQIGKSPTGGVGPDGGFYIYELTTGQTGTRFAIQKSGNVGIGTTTPEAKLVVSGGDLNVSQTGVTDTRIRIHNASSGWGSNDGLLFELGSSNNTNIWNYENGSMNFGTNNAERMRITNAGNVGIGTTTPQQRLVVQAPSDALAVSIAGRTGGQEEGWFRFYRNNGATLQGGILGSNNVGLTLAGPSGTNDLNIISGGNVGIGVTAPSKKLVIAASDDTAGNYQARSAALRVVNTSASAANSRFAGVQFGMQDDADDNQVIGAIGSILTDTSSQWSGPMVFATKASVSATTLTEYMRIDVGGNVGIGTTGPNAKLTVGALSQNGRIQIDGNIGNPTIGFGNGEYTGTVPLYNSFIETIITGAAATTKMNFVVAGAGNASTTVMSLLGNGNVGIGTTGPGAKLHVVTSAVSTIGALASSGLHIGEPGITNGISQISFGWSAASANTYIPAAVGFITTDSAASTKGALYFATRDATTDSAPSERMRITSTGNVGIGNTSPGTLLHVGATTLAKTAIGQSLVTLGSRITVGDVQELGLGRDPGATLSMSTIGNIITAGDAFAKGAIYFATRDVTTDTAPTERMRITSAGNVGIGTTSPTASLSVSGTTLLSNNLTMSGGQLFASIGSVAAPSYSFVGDSNTGIYQPANTPDNVQIAVNGATRAIFNADGFRILNDSANDQFTIVKTTGNVGIGTTSPWGQLSVNPNGITGPAFVVGSSTKTDFVVTNGGNVGIGTTTPAAHFAVSGGAGVYITSLGSSGRIGINTSNPATTLDIASGGAIFRSSLGGSALLDVHDSSGNYVARFGDYLGSGAMGYLLLFDTGSEKVRISADASSASYFNSGSNVGIGTTSPGSLLSLGNTGANTINISPTATSTFGSGINVLTGCFAINGTCVGGGGSLIGSALTKGYFVVGNDAGLSQATSTIFISSNGNVGIGTTSPAGKLNVAGDLIITNTSGAVDRKHWFLENSSDGFAIGTTSDAWVDAPSPALTISFSGNVGVNDATPDARMDIVSNAAATPVLRLEHAASPSSDYLQIASSGGSGGNILTLTSAGNLGIGTTSPYAKLSVAGETVAGLYTATTTGFRGPDGSLSSPAFSFAGFTNSGLYMSGSGQVSGTVAGVEIFRLNSSNQFAINNSATVSYTWFGDANTGFGNPAADILTAYTGGNERFRIDSSGNVGIGTTSPYAKLSVTNTGSGPSFVVEDDTSPDATPFIVDASGNVGIGTPTPIVNLHVRGVDPRIILEGSTTAGPGIQLRGTGTFDGRTYMLLSGGSANTNLGAGKFSIYDVTGDAYRLNIDASGNVGIGTTSPWGKLSVTGAGTGTGKAFVVADSANSPKMVVLDNGNVGIGTTSPSAFLALGIPSSNRALAIADGTGAEQLTIRTQTGAAFLGIGTTTPAAPLSVAYTSNVAALLVSNTGTGYTAYFEDATGDTTPFVIDASGNVGIGTTSPSRTLEVNGQVLINSTAPEFDLHNPNAIADEKRWRIVAGETAENLLEYKVVIDSLAASNNYMVVERSGATVVDVSFPGGNIGVGTTTPGSKLSVSSGVSVGTNYGVAAPSNGMIIEGNVGIGTNAPGTRLHVVGGDIYTINSGGNPRTVYGDSTAGGSYGEIGWNSANDYIHLGTQSGGADTMVINESGNVGIGTTTPSQELHVWKNQNASTQLLIENRDSSASANASLVLQGVTGDDYIGLSLTSPNMTPSGVFLPDSLELGTGLSVTNGMLILTRGAAPIRFAINSVEQMRIDSSGNVGIGTTDPTLTGGVSSKLTIVQTAGNTALAIATSTTGKSFALNVNPSGGWTIYDGGANGTAWVEGLSQLAGNVGIGTNPGTNLTIKQSTNSQYSGGIEIIRSDTTDHTAILTGGDNALYLFAATTWAKFAPGESAWTFSSDKRLKENIQYIESSGLDVINQLKPVLFNFIGATQQQAGFIAQDVLPVLPNSISTSITGYYGMNQTMVIPYLVKATQELASTTIVVQDRLDKFAGFFIDPSGNVGIGTTTPAHTLDVAGDVAAISFVNTSTRSLKTDVSYLSASSTEDMLDRLVRLQAATYRYTIEKESDPLHIGLIAEDAATIAPEILSPDGKGVDLYKLATFTLSGVQALAAKVDAQETRLATLEERLLALESGAISTASGSPITLSSSTQQITNWLASAGNGIGDLFAKTFRASEKICVDDQCLTKDDVRALLTVARAQTANSSGSSGSMPSTADLLTPSVASSTPSTEATSTTSTSATSTDALSTPTDATETPLETSAEAPTGQADTTTTSTEEVEPIIISDAESFLGETPAAEPTEPTPSETSTEAPTGQADTTTTP